MVPRLNQLGIGVTFLVLCILSTTARAQPVITRILRVDDNATCTGCSCGGTWTNAFQRLHEAITCTDNDDLTTEQIWVARGTYTPPTGNKSCAEATLSDPSPTFCLKNSVEIYGGFVGIETVLAQRPLDSDPYTIDVSTDSVLSGDRNGNDVIHTPGRCDDFTGTFWIDGKCVDRYGLPVTERFDNASNVVTAPDGIERDKSILDGFTITGGTAGNSCEPNDPPPCEPFPTNPEPGGGGIRVLGVNADTGGPTVRNCAILYNFADNGGGGVYGYGYITGRFIDCVIAYNKAGHGGGFAGKGTGGLELVNCQIVGNVAEDIASGSNRTTGGAGGVALS